MNRVEPRNTKLFKDAPFRWVDVTIMLPINLFIQPNWVFLTISQFFCLLLALSQSCEMCWHKIPNEQNIKYVWSNPNFSTNEYTNDYNPVTATDVISLFVLKCFAFPLFS